MLSFGVGVVFSYTSCVVFPCSLGVFGLFIAVVFLVYGDVVHDHVNVFLWYGMCVSFNGLVVIFIKKRIEYKNKYNRLSISPACFF